MPCRAHAHRALHRALHGAAERDALRQLVAMLSATSCASSSGRLISSTLIPTSLPVRLRELVAELVDFGALLPDDDARTAGVDRHDDLARLALDRDVRRSPRARGAPSGTCGAARPPAAARATRGPAYHRELHCLVMPRRKPIGWSSVPLVALPLLGTPRSSHVAGPLLNRRRASLRGRHEPLELRPLVDRSRA